MKKITHRAWSALILAVALCLGMGVYLYRFATGYRQWVSFSANQNIFTDGALAVGVVTDRSGLTLAGVEEGKRVYAADAAIRTACLHAVGDGGGNIGTGALTAFAGRLTGYDLISGASKRGATVALSIDAELNRVAWEALAGRRGAVLLSDYRTGEILCMVSSPSYDPETGFDSADEWYDGVYLNRCLSAAYTPGSVFKLVTLAAALEKIDDLYERSFECSGSMEVDGSVLTCSGIHGSQTIEQALANSCNCAFAALSLELGGETLARYADKLGFTSQHACSGVWTAKGRFEAGEAGSPDLAWSGIGQATDLVCPAALQRYVSAIAGGGVTRELSLLAGESGAKTRLLREDTADKLAQMMRYNVSVGYGDGLFPGLSLCAKTGTAEVGDGSSHAWFTGFLDDPEHPYAFTVVVERGGGGLRNAAPIANAVLQAAVSKY